MTPVRVMNISNVVKRIITMMSAMVPEESPAVVASSSGDGKPEGSMIVELEGPGS